VMAALDQDPSLIDSVDQFGWSLLMVAACAGALPVVDLLLHFGANTNLRDKAGHSCISLAKKRGHLDIAEKIKKFRTIQATEDVVETEALAEETLPYEEQLCSACNSSFIDSTKKSHLTSTVHQLSLCSKGCKAHYSISGSNRGYQLMLKNGWDGETGLGPSGSGIKFPPKTTLKRDRKGLGLSKGTARITHFRPNDTKAVAGNPLSKRHENKRILKQRLHHEKMVEVSLRRELINMDNPEKSLLHLTQIEEQAQEILSDREDIVALDKQRNQNREAIRALHKQDKTSAWITVGPLLVKMPIKKVSDTLNKEQVRLDVEVNRLRSDLKVKVNKLRDLEHSSPVPGLMLNPMSRAEMNAIGQVLGR
ncbi:G patch domain and ankyrin repeat-containing protein 1-like protein, partial [Frankliniella fusca]